jgi:hypothetical protein
LGDVLLESGLAALEISRWISSEGANWPSQMNPLNFMNSFYWRDWPVRTNGGGGPDNVNIFCGSISATSSKIVPPCAAAMWTTSSSRVKYAGSG